MSEGYKVTSELPGRPARAQFVFDSHQTLFARRNTFFFFFFSFISLTWYSRWTSSLPSCLWSQRIFPSLPGSRLTIFLSRCEFSTLTTRQPMVEFYLLTFPRFPLRKKEHKSDLGKNQTHDFRTRRCAAYLLGHSGDERYSTVRLEYANKKLVPRIQQAKQFDFDWDDTASACVLRRPFEHL